MLVLTCVMERVEINTGEVITTNVPSRSRNGIIVEEDDVNQFYENAVDRIEESIDTFQMQRSNWKFERVVKLDINTAEYKPLKGKGYIDLIKTLKSKKDY